MSTIGSEAATYQRLRDHLHVLRLSAAAEALPGMLDDARGQHLSTVAMLEQLLAVEVETTQARRLASRLRFADRKIPKVSRAADGTRPNMPSRVAMRECEFGGLRGGLESDVESHRGQVGDVVADLSLGDHAAGVIVGAEVVKSGGGVGK